MRTVYSIALPEREAMSLAAAGHVLVNPPEAAPKTMANDMSAAKEEVKPQRQKAMIADLRRQRARATRKSSMAAEARAASLQ